jgi:2-polyprenyl-6-methoxyphenol hydroxylase-like FAD-dependent oxidoreductase
MLTKDTKVAIVGGGPGGLVLARLLQLKGVSVIVYERDKSRAVRVQGATLDLHEGSGLKALEVAGLMDAFKASYRPDADKLRITDQQGTLIFDDHLREQTADFGDEHFRPEIDRGPLRELLLDSLDPSTVVWDSHIVGLEREGKGWLLKFQQGTTAYTDLVIGADGANSKIRPYVTPLKAFYAGVTVVEGAVYDAAVTTPNVYDLLKGGKLFALGQEQSLIVSSKGDGSLAFYTGCKTTEHWVKDSEINFSNREEVLVWFKEAFAGWGSIWQELFTNDKTYFIPRPQYCMPLDQSWDAKSNITLLGDAAHLMPPYAGEGVNMAMLDALELSECLTSKDFTDLRSAIAHYENQMRKRASETAQLTLQQTEALHAVDGLQYLVGMLGGGRE